MKTPERRQWCRSVVFILTLNTFTFFSGVYNVGFEQVNVNWVVFAKNDPLEILLQEFRTIFYKSENASFH